jgi:hypothetical protein
VAAWSSLTGFFSKPLDVGIDLSASDVVYDQNGGKQRIEVDLRQSSLTIDLTAVF